MSTVGRHTLDGGPFRPEIGHQSDPLPEHANVRLYSVLPMIAVVYDEQAGGFVLVNPHSGVGLVLETPPEYRQWLARLTEVGIAGLRARYGQEVLLRLFACLAAMPGDEEADAEAGGKP